jgi:hypothetical protein
MSDFVYCTIFIKPQEGATLPVGFRDQFVDENDDFTFAKTLPTEEFDAYVDYQNVGAVSEDTLTIGIETPDVPVAWLNSLASKHPNLIIECEHHLLSQDTFGRIVWAHGGVVLDRNQTSISVERFEYFGGDVDECDDSYDIDFKDEAKEVAVKAVRSAVESEDWVRLMDALLTARHELDYFQNYNLEEDALRLAVVAYPASLKLIRALLTDSDVDSTPISAQLSCEADDEDSIAAGEELGAPATRDDLLEVLESIALQSSMLLSLSSHHSVEKEIGRMKAKASQEATR